jgi:hypothetical protein
VDLQIIDKGQLRTGDGNTVQFGPHFAIRLLVLGTSLSTAANEQLQTRGTEPHLGKVAVPPWLNCLERKIYDHWQMWSYV